MLRILLIYIRDKMIDKVDGTGCSHTANNIITRIITVKPMGIKIIGKK